MARQRFVELTSNILINPDFVESLRITNVGGREIVKVCLMSGDTYNLPASETLANVRKKLEEKG